MTGSELWIEVMGMVTVPEVQRLTIEAGATMADTIALNVRNWSEVCEMPAGESVETLTATLTAWVTSRPLGPVPWDQESRFYGSRVLVKGEFGEPNFETTVRRIFNDGTYFELRHPRPVDPHHSFRAGSNLILAVLEVIDSAA